MKTKKHGLRWALILDGIWLYFHFLFFRLIYHCGEGPPFLPAPPLPVLDFRSARGAILTPGALGTDAAVDVSVPGVDVDSVPAAVTLTEVEEDESSASTVVLGTFEDGVAPTPDATPTTKGAGVLSCDG